jgi:hypothetical protein
MKEQSKNIQYWVVVDKAAHEGFISSVDLNDHTWTEQDVIGPHGHLFHTTKDENDAQQVLDNYLICHSVENNSYCYSHNKFPQSL